MTVPRASTHIGMLLFPNMTQLDFTGPYEVFSRLPETTVHIVAASLDPVRTDHGLVLAPSTTYTTCPQLDVVVVPGGPGQEALMQDEGFWVFCGSRRRARSMSRRCAPARSCWARPGCSLATGQPPIGRPCPCCRFSARPR